MTGTGSLTSVSSVSLGVSWRKGAKMLTMIWYFSCTGCDPVPHLGHNSNHRNRMAFQRQGGNCPPVQGVVLLLPFQGQDPRAISTHLVPRGPKVSVSAGYTWAGIGLGRCFYTHTHTPVLIVSDQPLLTTVMVPTHGRYSGHTYTSEVRMPGGRSHAVELFSQPQVETQSSKQI